VFVRSGASWSQQAYLKSSNTQADDSFGQSVAISSDTIVVGAFTESSRATGINGNQTDNSAPLSGAAYVFLRNDTNWTQLVYLKASNTESADFFGFSAAVAANTVIIGAREEDSGSSGVNGSQLNNTADASGAGYIFDLRALTSIPDIAPVFTLQPQSQTVFEGASVTFTVVVAGTSPFVYQWRKDGTPITGATAVSYQILNVQTDQAGAYSVIVSNAVDRVTSVNALLTVIPQVIVGGQILTNGSFEEPAVAPNTYVHSTPLSWIWAGPAGFIFNGNGGLGAFPIPEDGQQYLDIGNQPTFAVSQSFKITGAWDYSLQWHDSAGQNILTTSPYSVAITDISDHDVVSTNLDAYHAKVWQRHQFTIALSPGSYNLTFRAEGVFNGTDTLIDDVGLEPVSAPIPPRFAGIQLLSDGAVQITVTGANRWIYPIEVSTNLTHWVVATNVFLASGTAQFAVPSDKNVRRQFYRIVIP